MRRGESYNNIYCYTNLASVYISLIYLLRTPTIIINYNISNVPPQDKYCNHFNIFKRKKNSFLNFFFF